MRHKQVDISRSRSHDPLLKGQGEQHLKGSKPNHCNATIQSLDGNKDVLITHFL